MHGHHVGVPLHKEAPLLLDDVGLGEVHAIQHLRLVVEDALRRVEVLGDFLVCGQCAASKPNDTARHIPNREHHPSFEEVPQRPVVALLAQPGFHQFLSSVPGFLGRRGHGVPRIGAVANQERVEHVVAKAPFHEVAAPNGLSGLGGAHLVHEPLGRPSDQVAQSLLGRGGRDFLGGALFFLNLDVVPTRQHPQRLRVARLLQLHQERHHTSSLAARETLEDAFGRQHVKRRGLLVRERAQATH